MRRLLRPAHDHVPKGGEGLVDGLGFLERLTRGARLGDALAVAKAYTGEGEG